MLSRRGHTACVAGVEFERLIFKPLSIRFHPMYMEMQEGGGCSASIKTLDNYAVKVSASVWKDGEEQSVDATFRYAGGTKFPQKNNIIYLMSIEAGQKSELSYQLVQSNKEVIDFKLRVGDKTVYCRRLRYFGDDCGDARKRTDAKR